VATRVHTRTPDTPTEPSLGELVSRATADISALARKEVELAKAEISAEVSKVGKGAGLFGGAGFLGHLCLVFASLALMFGLGHWISLGWAALVVAGLYAVLAAVLAVAGKRKLATLDPAPHRTIKTLKEDAAWVRHPTS
jgi:ABC-type multidrug transport system fused ATPase/permease subunit